MRLQVLQNRCLKVIFNLSPFFPTFSLYSNLNHKVIPVLGLRDCQTIMYVHNTLNNRSFHHNISFPYRLNIHNTRHAFELSRSRAYTNLGLERITSYGPLKFNSLPNDLKNIINNIHFKSKLKQHLLRNVNDYLL